MDRSAHVWARAGTAIGRCRSAARGMSHRWLATLGAVALLVPGFAVVVPSSPATAGGPVACEDVAEFAPVAPVFGTGANEGKYLIASEANLVFVSVNQNGDTGLSAPKSGTTLWREQDFVQTVNLDFEGCDLKPIGAWIDFSNTPVFAGTYDGGNNTIAGLVVSGDANVGLFGYTGATASLKSIRLVDVTVSATGGSAGGLVGNNEGTISESFVSGSVSAPDQSSTGGLVGYNAGTITAAYSAVAVTGKNRVGGLVGSNEGSIARSFATGEVIATGDEIGGLVGLSFGPITDSYATGDVSGGEVVGGLVGYNVDLIRRSYAAGDVSGQGDVGGLVGSHDEDYGDIEDSYWDTQASGITEGSFGEGRTTSQMRQRSTFAGWAFAGDADPVWDICEDEGYPFLIWFDVTCGGAPSAPAVPSGVTTIAGDGQVAVSWSAPDDGGSAITGYTVTADPGNATCTATPPATSCVVTGLANGTAYTFTIVATNAIGSSAPSSPSAAVEPSATGGNGSNVDGTGDGETGASGGSTPVLQGGSVPVVPTGTGVWQQVDGSTTQLAVSSSGVNQIRYSSDGIRVTLTGGPGTSVANGLVADPNGEIVGEVCSELPVGQVIEVWMFSAPRLVAAHLIGPGECRMFSIPLAAPLDGGGPVSAGAHTLQLVLPTASGMQAVNVGVTVGSLLLPTSVRAGEGPVGEVTLAWGRLFLLLGLLGGVGAARTSRRERQVVTG
jgi:hypothetical protein